MVFTVGKSIVTFRKYNMKMAIWHIKTYFVVKGYNLFLM